MKANKKETISFIIFGLLLVLFGLLSGTLINIGKINKLSHEIELKDANLSILSVENELLHIKVQTPKNDLLECQENMGKIWEEATVVTDAYNLCKAQLNKRKK